MAKTDKSNDKMRETLELFKSILDNPSNHSLTLEDLKAKIEEHEKMRFNHGVYADAYRHLYDEQFKTTERAKREKLPKNSSDITYIPHQTDKKEPKKPAEKKAASMAGFDLKAFQANLMKRLAEKKANGEGK